MKDFNDFMRECYLNSVPSVDINATEEEIDCTKHRLSLTKYEELVKELQEALKDKATKSDVYLAANMWCLNSGPSIVNE